MNRRFVILAALAVAAHWQSAFAQIVVPASLKPFEKIEAVCQKGAVEGREVVYEWRSGPAVTWMEPVDGGRRLLVGAPPGSHFLTCKVTVFATKVVLVPDPEAPDDPGKFKRDTLRYAETLELFDAVFRVEGAGPAPVPTPGPTPTPLPGTLGELVPADARAPLAEFYADLAAVVKAGGFVSTTHFRAGYRLAIKTAQDVGKFPLGVSAIDKPISGSITDAIGLAEAPLDADKQLKLAAALEVVAGEFRGS